MQYLSSNLTSIFFISNRTNKFLYVLQKKKNIYIDKIDNDWYSKLTSYIVQLKIFDGWNIIGCPTSSFKRSSKCQFLRKGSSCIRLQRHEIATYLSPRTKLGNNATITHQFARATVSNNPLTPRTESATNPALCVEHDAIIALYHEGTSSCESIVEPSVKTTPTRDLKTSQTFIPIMFITYKWNPIFWKVSIFNGIIIM